MSASITLHTWTFANTSLQTVLTTFAKLFPDPCAVILYGFDRCRFAQLQPSGQILDEQNQPCNLSHCYEARAFNTTAELRWLTSEDLQSGQAVILAETELALPNWIVQPAEAVIAQFNREYLLWGKPILSEARVGWSRLAANQIGSFFVPHDCADQQRLVLHAREYVGRFQDGNAAVFEERLIRLEEYHEEVR